MAVGERLSPKACRQMASELKWDLDHALEYRAQGDLGKSRDYLKKVAASLADLLSIFGIEDDEDSRRMGRELTRRGRS